MQQEMDGLTQKLNKAIKDNEEVQKGHQYTVRALKEQREKEKANFERKLK
jgi:hypothetical protein